MRGAHIRFAAAGFRLAAFRDALRRAGIPCDEQLLRDGRFHAVTRPGCERAILRLAAEYGVTVTVTERKGLRYRLRRYRLRWGLAAGLALGGWFLQWCDQTVRSIEIYGNTEISDTELLRALAVLGVERGVPLREIPYTYVEQRMRLLVRDIEWIALRHTGGRLIVDLTEETPAPETTEPHTPANIVAAVPAQITAMDVRGGHAVCAAGDVVQPDDLLITGVQADSLGFTRLYRAEGTVTGIYQAEFTAFQPFVEALPVHTETRTETLLEVFGQRLSLAPRFEPPADVSGWDYEETRTPLVLLGQTLPLCRIDCHYTKNETALNAWSEAEAERLLLEAAGRWVRNFHADDRLISRSAGFTRSDLGISLKMHYVFEGVIGKTSEIFVKLS